MGRLRTVIVAAIALIILYVIVSQAQAIGAPLLFTAVGVVMALLIVLNVGRSMLRGY